MVRLPAPQGLRDSHITWTGFWGADHGGILGSGVASGAITLGGGVLAGLVIDAILDRLLRALGHDPEADIEKQVSNALEYCEDLVLHGKNFAEKYQVIRSNPGLLDILKPENDSAVEKPGPAAGKETKDEEKSLYYYLFSLNAERTMLRDEALEKLVLGGDGR